MIEPVDTQDFTSQPDRRKPEQFEHVKFRIDGGVARMTLNRPDHNLLNEAMLREIAAGITHAGESDDVQLIVLDSALKLGRVNRLVRESQLEQGVKDLVGRISGHSGPVLTMAKKAILGGMGLSLREGLKHSMNIFLNELYRLEDSQEGLRALVEKRKPNWKNR